MKKKKNNTPLVCVTMANYDNASFLREALESICAQTYPHFEVVVVDDCSTDGSWEILKGYAPKGVRIFRNDTNLGIPKTRNRLLQEASAEARYIAILDSDDVMFPARLEKQVEFLEAHEGVGAVGSWLELIDKHGEHIGERQYPQYAAPKESLCLNPVAQPAAMLRAKAVDSVGEYDERFLRMQDHQYFLRMLARGWKIANIQEALTQYRVHKKEGVHGRTRLHIWYGFRSRIRFLFNRKFFSIKGCVITIGYLCASVLPPRLVSLVRKRFFSGYDIT